MSGSLESGGLLTLHVVLGFSGFLLELIGALGIMIRLHGIFICLDAVGSVSG